MLSLIDVFRRCTIRAAKLGLSANEKAVMYALMYIWNFEGRKDSVKVDVRTVHELANIPHASFSRAILKINTAHVGFRFKILKGKRIGTLMFIAENLTGTSEAFSNARAQQSKEAEEKEEKIGYADFPSFDSAEVKERTPNESINNQATVHGAGTESNRNDRHDDELQSSLSLLERFGGHFPR